MNLPWFLACDHLADGQSNGLLIGDNALGTATTGTNYTIGTVDGIKGARQNSSSATTWSLSFPAQRRIIVGLRWLCGTGVGATSPVIGLRTGGTIQLNLTQTALPATLVIRRGTTVLENISDGYTDAVWRYVELVADIHPTEGSYEVWIDGVMVASATGVNTGSADVDGAYGGSGGQILARVTDWYIKEWEDATTPGRYGPLSFNYLPITSDVSNVDWTPDTGTELFSRINDPYPDAGYVETTTLGALAKFGVTDLPAGVNSIIAVVPVSVSHAPDGGAPQIALGAETTGGTAMATSRVTGTSSPNTQTFPLTTKPGGGAWTAAAVNEMSLVLEAAG
jgi:hypothetical protein